MSAHFRAVFELWAPFQYDIVRVAIRRPLCPVHPHTIQECIYAPREVESGIFGPAFIANELAIERARGTSPKLKSPRGGLFPSVDRGCEEAMSSQKLSGRRSRTRRRSGPFPKCLECATEYVEVGEEREKGNERTEKERGDCSILLVL